MASAATATLPVFGYDKREVTVETKEIKRCDELFRKLLVAAYDRTQPIDRELAKGAAECGAYLLGIARRADGQQVPKEKIK